MVLASIAYVREKLVKRVNSHSGGPFEPWRGSTRPRVHHRHQGAANMSTMRADSYDLLTVCSDFMADELLVCSVTRISGWLLCNPTQAQHEEGATRVVVHAYYIRTLDCMCCAAASSSLLLHGLLSSPTPCTVSTLPPPRREEQRC